MYRKRLPARCLATALALAGVFVPPLHPQTWQDFRTPTPIGPDDTLVIGFLGGRERWDHDERSPRKGEWPTHAELLDWLAVEFMESGWDVKGILKTILMSATYRQSSKVTPELIEKRGAVEVTSRPLPVSTGSRFISRKAA